MADKMMRVAGRGEDGNAKAIATDNNGVAFTKTPVLKTTHHNLTKENSVGDIADVYGYNSITFQVIGYFVGEVTFEATSYGESWTTIRVEDENGNNITSVNSIGLYKANISGYERVRAVVKWESGSYITIISVATLASHGAEKPLLNPGENNVVNISKSDYQVGKNIARYGINANTNMKLINPVDFRNYSKRSVYVKNNLDLDITIIGYYKHFNPEVPSLYEFVPSEIFVPVGKLGKLSFTEYPCINEPFYGLSIDVQAKGIPSSGDLDIYWLGGVY